MKIFISLSIFLMSFFGVSAQSLEINLKPINPALWPFVWDIVYDQDSTIWACDEVGGLFYKTNTSENFVKFTTPVIGQSTIRAVSALSINDIWIAVDDHGLFHYNGTSWTKFATSEGLPILEDWRSIDRDSEGNIWFGNYGEGVARYNGSSWAFYNENNSGLESDFVSELIVDNDDNVWAGASEFLMKFNGFNWTTRDLDDEFGFRTWINSFYIDDLGRFWITTDDGVLVQENGVLKSKKNEFGEKDFGAIAVDKKGVIWIVETFEGLWRYENNQGRLFTEEDNEKVPTQAWKILVSSENEKLLIGNRGANLIVINDDAFSSSTSFTSGPYTFELYPNPAFDKLFVKTDAQIVQYKLYDLSGRLCEEKSFEGTDEVIQIHLDQKMSTSEMFILQLTTKEGLVLNRKLVVR